MRREEIAPGPPRASLRFQIRPTYPALSSIWRSKAKSPSEQRSLRRGSSRRVMDLPAERAKRRNRRGEARRQRPDEAV
jgi:hypothetical protein